MSLVNVLVGAGVGGGLGYAGVRISPRWLSRPARRELQAGLIGCGVLLCGLLAATHGIGLYFWPNAIFLALLAVAAYVDLQDRIIPNELVIFGLGFGLIAMLALPRLTWGPAEALTGGLTGFGLLFGLALAVRGGMGLGDVKLAAVIGLFLGWPWVLMGLVMGFLSGGLVAGGLMAARRVGRKDVIPFGPFLALGAALTALYGPAIWTWYITL